jgi:hypothetical protein
MAKVAAQDVLTLDKISEYHEDAVDSLQAFFEPVSAGAQLRYLFSTPKELEAIRNERIIETELRSALAVLATIEAAFRVDFLTRCQEKKKDALSRVFRGLNKRYRKPYLIDLDNQILESWAAHHPEFRSTIGELRGALNYRHWLAHGRYFIPKLGRRYDYSWLYLLAKGIADSFPFAT